MSGISVNDKCVTEYNNLKLNKKLQYVELKMSDNLKEVAVGKIVPKTDGASPEQQFELFVSQLPKSEARYYIYDFQYKNPDGDQREKILFILWAPGDSPIKQKMVYTSTKDSLKKKLVGLGAEIQATDFDEISYEAILGRFNKTA